MRIAFDVHGTLDNDPYLVAKEILSSMQRIGHEIFIISGPPVDQIKKEIELLGISPHNVKIISVVDWLQEKGVKMWQDINGNWWSVVESEWWNSKGTICKENYINIIFDDNIKYLQAMPETTKFIIW